MPPVLYHTGRFPPDAIEWSRLIPLLGPAAAAVARYDGMLAAVPNPAVLLAPLTTQEAVRGQSKSPGEFRHGHAWIGSPDSPIEQAQYVAAEPEQVADLMAAWERYANGDAADRLVHTAVLHAEFEAIHPFADGNGRLGRLLIPLYLAHVGIIRRPMFYLSAYLEAHRGAYYERLLAVSRDGDWTGWCEFFLEAIRCQAIDNLAKANAILDLFEQMKRRLPEMTRSQHAVRALDWIFARPIFSSVAFVEQAGIPEPTARRFLRLFQAEDLLRTVAAGSGRRPTIFGFPQLLEIVEGRPVV